jgi:hypothetical protein
MYVYRSTHRPTQTITALKMERFTLNKNTARPARKRKREI